MDKPIGELSIQIELYTHPGSGERKVTVKGQFEFLKKIKNVILRSVYLTSCPSPLCVCMCSRGSQRLKMADVRHVPALCRDHHDRTSPQRQEA